MNEKKKRKFLTYEEQAEVIKKLKAGVPTLTIRRDYGISKSLCYKLWSRNRLVLNKISSSMTMKRKTCKPSGDETLDKAVITWFQQTRDKGGETITGPILQEKALIFSEKLNMPPTFKASSGWLKNFKKRYCIKQYTVHKGEKIPADIESTKSFTEILEKKIIEENLDLENIYNADESGIFWKTLVSRTLSQNTDEEERVTALFCANASGSHRIPLLIIGKSEIPPPLSSVITPNLRQKLLKFLPSYGIVYTHQSKAWMDAAIFKLWFSEVFIPSVVQHQQVSGTSGKVVLILDNAPVHLIADGINTVDPNFEIIFLPPNVPDTVQPMDQGAISLAERHYKNNLLKQALFYYKGALKFLPEIEITDCLIHLNDAWNSITNSTLNRIWKTLLGETFIINEDYMLVDPLSTSVDDAFKVNCDYDELVEFPVEMCNQLSHVFAQNNQSAEQLKANLFQWFHSNDSDCGWEALTDDGIVNFVTRVQFETVTVNNENDKVGKMTKVDKKITVDKNKKLTTKIKETIKSDEMIQVDEIKIENSQSGEMSAEGAMEALKMVKNWMSETADYKFFPRHYACIKEIESIIENKIRNLCPLKY